AGVLVMEGGEVNAWQIRTTYLGSNNRFAFLQRGGTVNIGTPGTNGPQINTYPRFALPYAECTFELSDGTLNIANPMNSGTSNNGGILIFAAPSNIKVTGGTINVTLPSSNTNFNVSSTAPFYNFNVRKSGAAGSSSVTLNAIAFNDNTAYTRTAQPLVILNDLTLYSGNTPRLNCNNFDLTVGGNFEIQAGTTYTSGTNTTAFNGSGTQTWTNHGTITSTLGNVVMNKTGVLQLTGNKAFPNIYGLTLTSGTLNDGNN